MFDNSIAVASNDINGIDYIQMRAHLMETFSLIDCDRRSDVTNMKDFSTLHEITKSFYRSAFSNVYENYVPLYHSVWKQRLKDLKIVDNIHQDGGVHYFSRNGYQSRMITIWTNIYKDDFNNLSDSDLGIFVIDNKDPVNQYLYEEMEKANTHFFKKRDGEIASCMYVAGPVLKCDTTKLNQTYFEYKEGTSIMFNSHLLHGSKRFHGDLNKFSSGELDKFRMSLTSVWLHKEDLDYSILSLPESKYEEIYLSRIERSLWAEVKTYFKEACETENFRLTQIKGLIEKHLSCL